jgi:hypothetical protein
MQAVVTVRLNEVPAALLAQPENLDPKSPLLFTVLQKALEYRYPMMWGRDTGLQK